MLSPMRNGEIGREKQRQKLETQADKERCREVKRSKRRLRGKNRKTEKLTERENVRGREG